MNMVKFIGGGLIAIVLLLTGMNQYESYKINKRANNAIDTIQEKLMDSHQKEKILANALATVSSVKSSIATERQKRILSGDFGEITDLSNGGNGVFTYFNNDQNGNKNEVLENPEKSCESIGCWSGSGNRYVFIDGNEKSVIFSLRNNHFECISNCSDF